MSDLETAVSDPETRAREAALETVAEIARKLAAAPSLDETLQRIVDLGGALPD